MGSWEDKVSTDTGDGTNITGSAAALYGLSSSLAAVPVHITRPKPGTPTGTGQPDPGLVTYDRAVSMLGLTDNTTRANFQQRLYESGFYQPKDVYTPGDYDDSTEKAWAAAVDKAAKMQKSVDEVLEDGKKKISQQGGPAGYYKNEAMKGRAPLTIKLTNPEDVKLVAQDVATKRLGRSFTEPELAKFLASYQGMESSAQSAEYAAGGVGGTSTAAAGPEAAAVAFAESQAPTEFEAHKKVQVFNNILKLLGGAVPDAARPGAGGAATGV